MVKHDSKTRHVDADFVLNTEKKIFVFENTRLRVDGQIRVKNATCGRRFFLNTEENISVLENIRLRVDGQIRVKNATCGRRFFLNTEENISVLENIRLRVDGQIRVKNATCGRRFCFKYGGKNLCFGKYPATCGWSNTIQKRDMWTQIFFF